MGKMSRELPSSIKSPLVIVRKQKGLTQAEMALVLNCTAAYLSDLEGGYADLSDKMIEALDDLKLGGKALARDHQEFREKKREWLVRLFLSKEEAGK